MVFLNGVINFFWLLFIIIIFMGILYICCNVEVVVGICLRFDRKVR